MSYGSVQKNYKQQEQQGTCITTLITTMSGLAFVANSDLNINTLLTMSL